MSIDVHFKIIPNVSIDFHPNKVYNKLPLFQWLKMEIIEITYKQLKRCHKCKKRMPSLGGYWEGYACYKCVTELHKRELRRKIVIFISLMLFIIIISSIFFILNLKV